MPPATTTLTIMIVRARKRTSSNKNLEIELFTGQMIPGGSTLSRSVTKAGSSLLVMWSTRGAGAGLGIFSPWTNHLLLIKAWYGVDVWDGKTCAAVKHSIQRAGFWFLCGRRYAFSKISDTGFALAGLYYEYSQYRKEKNPFPRCLWLINIS